MRSEATGVVLLVDEFGTLVRAGLQREPQDDLVAQPEQGVDRPVRGNRAHGMVTPPRKLIGDETGHHAGGDVDLVGMHLHRHIFTAIPHGCHHIS